MSRFRSLLIVLGLAAFMGLIPSAAQATGEEGTTVSLSCVAANGDGTYTAKFGYTNPGTTTFSAPVGSSSYLGGTLTNTLSAGKSGQTTSFAPGSVAESFTVNFTAAESVTWALKFVSGSTTYMNTSATATKTSPSCAPPGDAPTRAAGTVDGITLLAGCVTAKADGTYTARLGYANTGSSASIQRGSTTTSYNHYRLTYTNTVTPAAFANAQPTAFSTGTNAGAFTVDFTANETVEWRISVTNEDRQGTKWSVTSTAESKVSVSKSTKACTPVGLASGSDAKNLTLTAACVTASGSGTYAAALGYVNSGSDVTITHGSTLYPVGGVNLRWKYTNTSTAGSPPTMLTGTSASALPVSLTEGQSATWTITATPETYTPTGWVAGAAQTWTKSVSQASPSCAPSGPSGTNLVQDLSVSVSCVTLGSDGKYTAVFKYGNTGSAVTIANGATMAGTNARWSYANTATAGTPPTAFKAGGDSAAFSVTFAADQSVTWTVSGAPQTFVNGSWVSGAPLTRTIEASKASPLCDTGPSLPGEGNGMGPLLVLAMSAMIVTGVHLVRRGRKA